jgi:pimeloyl-ACP methyl ester carboxylesterase
MTGTRSCEGAGRGSGRGAGTPVTVVQRQVRLHGQHVTYLEAGVGRGPVVVLLHGLASSSATWADVIPLLGRRAHVVAPDLLGHGDSAKPRSGDYSLGAHAAGLRDLLAILDLERATVVGHSFGGGVALQFAYQYPELTERVVLVASGGLGHGVNLALRAATLPGASTALNVVTATTPRWLSAAISRAARAVPVLARADREGLLSAFASFADGGARDAFVQSTRGALDLSGQRLTGTGRLHLLAETPVLLVAGSRDPVIPVDHTVDTHEALPGSRLELFDGAGHFPHIDDPRRFAHLVEEFLASTEPVHADRHSLRRHLQETR